MKNFDKIERYLKNEMEVSEKEAFEKEMKKDEKLAIEVELQKSENIALEGLAFDVLKKEIAALDQENKKDLLIDNDSTKVVSMTPRSSYFRPLAIAASIALLLLAGYFVLKEKNPDQPDIVENPDSTPKETPGVKEAIPEVPTPKEEIAQTPKKQPKIDPIPLPDYTGIAMAGRAEDFATNIRGNGKEETDAEWKIMLEKFSNKKYTEVVSLIDAMNPEHQFYVDARQLKAESLFLTSKFAAAAKMYKGLLENGDDFQKDSYEYELLRCLVAQLAKTKPAVDSLFEKILTNPDHIYLEDAKKLQGKLQEVGY
ncbi:MAG: hypothetical protein ACI8P3_003532 [Saprospiraceae bacterium]|jgi:hypothetical protein